jgi:hypothetical protein
MVDRVVYAVQTCTNCLPDLNMLISPQFMQFFEEQVWRTVCRRCSGAHTVPKPCNQYGEHRKLGLSAYIYFRRPKAMVQSSRGHYLGQVINVVKCQATIAVIPVLLTGLQSA